MHRARSPHVLFVRHASPRCDGRRRRSEGDVDEAGPGCHIGVIGPSIIELQEFERRIAALEEARDKRDEKQKPSRVEVLESEGRSRKLHRQSISKTISFLCWKIVLAYYVGGLRPDDEDPAQHMQERWDMISGSIIWKHYRTRKNQKSIIDLGTLRVAFLHKWTSTSIAARRALYRS